MSFRTAAIVVASLLGAEVGVCAAECGAGVAGSADLGDVLEERGDGALVVVVVEGGEEVEVEVEGVGAEGMGGDGDGKKGDNDDGEANEK